jgi:protein TonB
MKSFNIEKGAATPKSPSRFQLKEQTKTKVNPLMNFQLGLIAALFFMYVAIEITTHKFEKVFPAATITETLPVESYAGEFTIVENQPNLVKDKTVKAIIPPVKLPQPDTFLPPVIDENAVDNSLTDAIHALEPVEKGKGEPVVDVPTTKGGPVKNEAPKSSHINGVSEVPLFPGCDVSLDRVERIGCLNEKMSRFVQRKLNAGLTEDLKGGNTVKITVVFTIGTNGLPKDIQVKAPNATLEQEALRVINDLPQMKPGKNNGVAVNVTYILPIVYTVR